MSATGQGLAQQSLSQADSRRFRLLGGFTAASAVFAVFSYEPLKWVSISGAVAAILVLAGVVAIAAARTARALPFVVIGTVLILLGVYRLVTYGHTSSVIGGSSSTAALLVGLGMSYLGIVAAANLRARAQG